MDLILTVHSADGIMVRDPPERHRRGVGGLMAFRVRDLVINVLPGPGGGGQQPFDCPGISNCYPFSSCGRTNACYPLSCRIISCIGTMCGGCTLDISRWPGFQQGDTAEELAALKEQLTQALSEVERAEEALAESMRPRSIDEIETLEHKLEDALSELKQRKEQLQERRPGDHE